MYAAQPCTCSHPHLLSIFGYDGSEHTVETFQCITLCGVCCGVVCTPISNVYAASLLRRTVIVLTATMKLVFERSWCIYLSVPSDDVHVRLPFFHLLVSKVPLPFLSGIRGVTGSDMLNRLPAFQSILKLTCFSTLCPAAVNPFEM